MSELRIYVYEKCDTCRKAIKFLRENQIAHEALPIREQPPAVEELRAMLGHLGGDVRRLFNTAGRDYQSLGMKDRLPGMGVEETLALLASNGNLVKRPFVLGAGVGLVGFVAAQWDALRAS